ncbi:MAG: TetR/AcrR family transcriptional regulator [Hyphomicrobiaceae bacterium]
MDEAPVGDQVRSKTKYHHGDLRESLISAAYELVCENGAENFSLADACRSAGVSTAAPYKHFRDRDEILEEVAQRGFDDLAEQSMAAVAQAGQGTLAGIAAMGQAYVAFAVENQALFRLMFGRRPQPKDATLALEQGRACFGGVIEQVAHYCARNDVSGNATDIAVRLWTFVHGAASLTIDEDYVKVVDDFDVYRMVRDATPLLLSANGTPSGAPPNRENRSA